MQHGAGEVYPHGIDDRFALYHLSPRFPDAECAVQRQPGHGVGGVEVRAGGDAPPRAIQGYVITEFTDLHWECNGLLDMARNPKRFTRPIADINADDVISARQARAWPTGRAKRVEVDARGLAILDTRSGQQPHRVVAWVAPRSWPGASSGIVAKEPLM